MSFLNCVFTGINVVFNLLLGGNSYQEVEVQNSAVLSASIKVIVSQRLNLMTSIHCYRKAPGIGKKILICWRRLVEVQ